MAKLSSFQLTLLSVWGASAVAALAGSFWLLENDWATQRTQPARIATSEAVMRSSEGRTSNQYREEAIALRQSVQQLERRNRILASRLDSLESDLGLITASIPTNPAVQPSTAAPQQEFPSQTMPTPLRKPLGSNGNSNLQEVGKTYTQPFPLKMPGTGKTPTDAQIGEALLSTRQGS